MPSSIFSRKLVIHPFYLGGNNSPNVHSSKLGRKYQISNIKKMHLGKQNSSDQKLKSSLELRYPLDHIHNFFKFLKSNLENLYFEVAFFQSETNY